MIAFANLDIGLPLLAVAAVYSLLMLRDRLRR